MVIYIYILYCVYIHTRTHIYTYMEHFWKDIPETVVISGGKGWVWGGRRDFMLVFLLLYHTFIIKK